MAKTIAYCTGYDNYRTKTDHRLGAVAAEARANTWRTFTTAHVDADGSGYVQVIRDGKVLHSFRFVSEAEYDKHTALHEAGACAPDCNATER